MLYNCLTSGKLSNILQIEWGGIKAKKIETSQNRSLRSPVINHFFVMVSNYGHPHIINCNSTVPIDAVMVKSYVDSCFNSMEVPVRVSAIKLYFFSKWIMVGLVNMLSISSQFIAGT